MKFILKLLFRLAIAVICLAFAFGAGFIGFKMLGGETFSESLASFLEFTGFVRETVDNSQGIYGVADGEKAVKITLGDGTVVSVSEKMAQIIEQNGVILDNVEELKAYINVVKTIDDMREDAQASDGEGDAQVPKNSEDVSFSEAKDVAKSAISRLSAAEITELISMAAGGFTAEEKVRVKEIVYAKFSSAEIQYYLSLYRKYGTSLVE